MDGDDARGPGQDEPPGKTEQQIFDEQVARAVREGRRDLRRAGHPRGAGDVHDRPGDQQQWKPTRSRRSPPQPTSSAGQSTPGGQAPPLTGDALGKQLFVSGKPDVGAIGCGSCHTMKAAGTTGTIGPNLDKELTADPASATRESIVDPNKEIVPGYSANVMPTNYGTALTKQELDALVNYVYHSTNTKAKAKAKSK